MSEDDLKRKSDFERLIRIDENVTALKRTLDSYPLPKIQEQIDEQGKKLDGHIQGHWQFWVAACAPVLVALAIFIFKR